MRSLDAKHFDEEVAAGISLRWLYSAIHRVMRERAGEYMRTVETSH